MRRLRLLSLHFWNFTADCCVQLKQIFTQHTDTIWPSAVGLLQSWLHRFSNWPSAVGLWFQTSQISHTITTGRNWSSAVGLLLTLIYFIFALIDFLHRRWWPSAVGSEFFFHLKNTEYNWPSAVGLPFLTIWHYTDRFWFTTARYSSFRDPHRQQCWPSAVGLPLVTAQYTDNNWPSAVGLHSRCILNPFSHRVFWPSAVGLLSSGFRQDTDNNWPSAVGLLYRCCGFPFLHRIVIWPSAVGLIFSGLTVNTDNSWPSAVGLLFRRGYIQYLHRFIFWPSAVGLSTLAWIQFGFLVFECCWTWHLLAILALVLALHSTHTFLFNSVSNRDPFQLFQFYHLFPTCYHWCGRWNIDFLGPLHSLCFLPTKIGRPTHSGNPGPNSGRSRQQVFSRFFLFCLLMLAMMNNNVWNGGEGYISEPCGDVGANTQWTQMFLSQSAKPHGTRPSMCYGTTMDHGTHNKIAKRSLKRAIRRAHNYGSTWYQGRLMQLKDFPEQMVRSVIATNTEPDPRSRLLPSSQATHVAKRRLKIVTWNPGGLSVARLDELRNWGLQHHVDILLIPETRWQYNSEWQDEDWCCIHSGDPNQKGSGLLCLVSRKLQRLQQIKWLDVIPGRLLHIRLQFADRGLDILGCYQHTNNPQAARQQMRHSWWQTLDKYMMGLPRRNLLVLAGDFNCSSGEIRSHVGSSRYTWHGKSITGTQHDDMGTFAALIRGHGLIALNTWDASQGPSYVKQAVTSRLDYILVRRQSADGAARRALHVWNAPFMAAVPDGHAPVFAHIPFNWHHAHRPTTGSGITLQQRQCGRDAWRADDARWNEFLQYSGQGLDSVMQQVPPHDHTAMIHVNKTLIDCFHVGFPSNASTRHVPTWKRETQVMHNKWYHRDCIGLFRLPTAANILKVWFHVMKFAKLQREHKRRAHFVRKARLAELLHEASRAATQHDSFRLFGIINRFSPKVARRRMQIRTQTGSLATPVEELAILRQYVSSKWAGPADVAPPGGEPPGVPFTRSELEWAISKIPVGKAVAHPFAPGLAWRAHACTIAHFVYDALLIWWNSNPPFIPQHWRDGWLQLIPKPNRAPCHPKFLRPLAMQDPLGKCIVGLLTTYAKTQTHHEMVKWPLWAYQQGRSAFDALLRVADHCRQVRSLLHSQKPTVFHRQQKLPVFTVCGGLQLFVDIDNAFDAVDRARLFASLTEIGVHDNITRILASWHCNTAYHITHLGEDHSILVGKGLRQGCKAAPYLWNSFMTMCMRRLAQRLDPGFIQDCITIFADDVHFGGIYHSERELQDLLLAIGIFLDTLREYGLTVNATKSNIILGMGGTSYRKAWNRVTQRDDHGLRVKIPLPNNETVLFPITKSAKYLGAIVSYGSFEDQTLRHRIQMARISFHRLHKWICTKHGLPARERFKLWQTCVMTTLQYSLLAIGFTDTGFKLFDTTVTHMLRQVLHDHSYITRRTNTQALQNFSIASPFALLHRAAENLCRTLETRRQSCEEHDIVHTLNWLPLLDLTRRLAYLATPGPGNPDPLVSSQAFAQTFQCALCDFHTTCVATFRRHCTTVHGFQMVRSTHANLSTYSLKGLPQCKFCAQTFTTWRSFLTHVQRGCQALRPGPLQCLLDSSQGRPFKATCATGASQMAHDPERAIRGDRLLSDADLQVLRDKPWGQRLLTLLTNRQFDLVHQEREACDFLMNYCGICGIWVGRLQSMQLHMRTFHSNFWQYVPTKSTQLTNLYSQESPCCCCGSVFKSQHMCPVWTQLALLLLHGGGIEGDTAVPFEHSALRCDLCHELFADTETLTGHLRTSHGLTAATWNQSRDSVADNPVCSHCGKMYSCMAGLRSHISQGRCQHYNPEAVVETLPIVADWLSFCLNGTMLDLYRAPMLKLRLTLTCQSCDRKFQRSMDLSHHLQTAHAALWHAAQATLSVLVGTFYEKRGCTCNPQANTFRVQHICVPFKQLAMQFHRQQVVPLMPITLTDSDIATLISTKVPRASRFLIERVLSQRHFEAFWKDAEVQQVLRERCLLCGGAFPPAALWHHIREEHVCAHYMIKYFLEQMLPRFVAECHNDFQCPACCQVFNLPPDLCSHDNPADRAALVQLHYQTNCPVLGQASVILASALHGCVQPGPAHRSVHAADDGGFSPSHAHAGQEPTFGTRSKEPQATPRPKKTRVSRGKRPATKRKSNDGYDEADGNHHCPPRPGPTESEAKRQFRVLLQQGGIRKSDTPASGSCAVEGHAGEPDACDAEDSTEMPSHPDPAEGPAQPADGNVESQNGRPNLPSNSGEQGDARGLLMAVPPVVPPEENQCDFQQEGSGHETDAGNVPGAHRALHQLGSSAEVSCTPEQAGQHGGAMEAAAPHEAGPSLRSSDSPLRQRGLDFGRPAGQASPAVSDTTGDQPDGHAGQRTGEGQGEDTVPWQPSQNLHQAGGTMTVDHLDLVSKMRRLTLGNDANWCYANAGLYCVLWTMLSVQPFEPAFWGPHFHVIAVFLLTAGPICQLECEPWIQEILQRWGDLMPHPIGHQQDSPEFLHQMLQWLDSSLFHMGWERRFLENDRCRIDDTGSKFMPIQLGFASNMAFIEKCYLSDLVKPWHQDRGMMTGLVHAPQCLLIQIERHYQHTDMSWQKCACEIYLDATCSLPMFCNDALRIEYVDYVVLAAVAHTGIDAAGHCRSAMRVQPTVQPDGTATQWLLTDDRVAPTPIWTLPQWFAQNTIMLGLVRADCRTLHLHRQEPQTAEAASAIPSEDLDPSARAILTLCNRLNRINEGSS